MNMPAIKAPMIRNEVSMFKLTADQNFESDWLWIEPKSTWLEPTESLYFLRHPVDVIQNHYQFDRNDASPSTARNRHDA